MDAQNIDSETARRGYGHALCLHRWRLKGSFNEYARSLLSCQTFSAQLYSADISTYFNFLQISTRAPVPF